MNYRIGKLPINILLKNLKYFASQILFHIYELTIPIMDRSLVH